MARKKKIVHNPYRLYSWSPEKKANRNLIKEAIRRAITNLSDAKELLNDNVRFDAACTYAQDDAAKTAQRSLHQEARRVLEYWRLRAFMPGAYGLARYGDRLAAQSWDDTKNN